jgi:hypothetical protein
MDETRKDHIPQISIEVNNLFIAPYSEEEFLKRLFSK